MLIGACNPVLFPKFSSSGPRSDGPCTATSTLIVHHFCFIFRGHTPTHRVTYSAECSCVSDADWGLQSDATTNSRLRRFRMSFRLLCRPKWLSPTRRPHTAPSRRRNRGLHGPSWTPAPGRSRRSRAWMRMVYGNFDITFWIYFSFPAHRSQSPTCAV